ncbi:MAG: DNA polymerase/3'-5' exonuclease PolX [Myxococcota bacterium]
MGTLDNSEIAAVFVEMADLTHIVGGDPHRIRAFRRAARVIENLPADVETAIKFGTFEKVPGIGPGTVRRCKQILRTGSCDDLRELRRKLPAGLRELLEVKGIGASTARRLWQHLKVSSVAELEYAIRAGDLERVPRMGQRTGEKLLRALEDHRKRIGRVPYVESRRLGLRLVAGLEGLPEVLRVTLAGSVRRGKATAGDLDVLVASDHGARVAARFVTLPEVDEVLLRGEGRCSVRLRNRQQADLRVLPLENWGAGLHYFTGSQLHNIAVRTRGLRVSGLKISDKGVFVRDTEIRVHPGTLEEDVFTAAQLPWIEPELRENTGEIEAAAAGRLPRLITAADLRGDLHMHTVASDGKGTAEEMAAAAHRLGHQYVAITDHTQALTVANGLDERRLLAQVRHLRAVEDRLGALRIAAGTEVDILPDGQLDLDLDVLRGLDWVIASVHSQFDLTGEQMTNRLIAAMETGVVDCIGHPTGRRLDQRGGSELDWDRLFQAARRCDVALEVNGNPYRMDLPDVACRRARDMGVHLAVNTDAHAPGHLAHQEFGLVTARRGWIEPKDVLNTRSWASIAELRADRFRRRGWVVPARRVAPIDHPLDRSGLGLPLDRSGLEDVGAARLAVDHWPEDAETVVVIAEPTAADVPDEPIVIGGDDDDDDPDGDDGEATAPPTDEVPHDDVDLDARLDRPLDDALRERLDRWLREGGDPTLEAALAARGPNPMQIAFGLLIGG